MFPFSFFPSFVFKPLDLALCSTFFLKSFVDTWSSIHSLVRLVRHPSLLLLLDVPDLVVYPLSPKSIIVKKRKKSSQCLQAPSSPPSSWPLGQWPNITVATVARRRVCLRHHPAQQQAGHSPPGPHRHNQAQSRFKSYKSRTRLAALFCTTLRRSWLLLDPGYSSSSCQRYTLPSAPFYDTFSTANVQICPEPHRNAVHICQPLRPNSQHRAQRHRYQVRLHACFARGQRPRLLCPRERHEPDLDILRTGRTLPKGNGDGH